MKSVSVAVFENPYSSCIFNRSTFPSEVNSSKETYRKISITLRPEGEKLVLRNPF